jgi:hypothetical protein
MNKPLNPSQLLQLISFLTSLANVHAVILLSVPPTGLFLILQICPAKHVSAPLCDALLAFSSTVPLSSPIEISYFLQIPIQSSLPYDCLSPILLQETDPFSQKS